MIKNRVKNLIKKIAFKLIELELFLYKKNNSGKKKLLLIRIDAIGDFVIFSPMLKYYRQLYPKYEITLLVSGVNEELAKLFINYIDKIILIDKERFNIDIFYRRKLLIELKKEGFDITIYPAYSRERLGDYIIRISNAKEKISFDGNLCNISKEQKQQNNHDYTKLIEATPEIISEPLRNREFIELLGKIKVDDYIPTLISTNDNKTEANVLLKKAGLKTKKFVVINPGAGAFYRIWQINKYIELINWLKTNYNFEIVVCGSPKEQNIVDQIKQASVPIINFVGKTNLITLAEILRQSILYIGSETGTLHLSSAVGTPTVCIMGGGHLGRFFPYGDLNKNRIVYDHDMKCKNDNWKCAKGLPKGQPAPCIANIQLDDVKKEIKTLLEKQTYD